MGEIKYAIEKVISEIDEDVKECMEDIADGYFYDYAIYGETGEMLDKEDAAKEFEKCISTIEIDDSGKYIVTQYLLIYGVPEIEEIATADLGYDYYYFQEYYTDAIAPFDQ